MPPYSTRELVRSHIGHYHFSANMLNVGVSREHINASLAGSGEALLNANPSWWCDRLKPVLQGDELTKYSLAIAAINELLDLEPEGMEEFNP